MWAASKSSDSGWTNNAVGKEVYIDEINFGLLSRHLPGLMEGQPALDALREKVALVPEALKVKDYDQIIDFLHHQVLPEEDVEAELEELGFKTIQIVHPTYLAMTFMELLRDLFPEATEYNGMDLYLLGREELLLLAEVLLLYQELFEQYEDAKTARVSDVSASVRKQFTMAGKELLEREIKSRETLGEDYSGKWFPQYFHFFMHIDPQGLKAAVLKGKGDVYLIVDSY